MKQFLAAILGGIVGYLVTGALFPSWPSAILVLATIPYMVFVAALVDPRATAKEFQVRVGRLNALRRQYMLWSLAENVLLGITVWLYLGAAMLIWLYGGVWVTPRESLEETVVQLTWGGAAFLALAVVLTALVRFLEASDEEGKGYPVSFLDEKIASSKRSVRLWNPVVAPFTLVIGVSKFLLTSVRWVSANFMSLTRYVFQNPVLAILVGFVFGWCFGALLGAPVPTAIGASICFFAASVLIWAVDTRVNPEKD